MRPPRPPPGVRPPEGEQGNSGAALRFLESGRSKTLATWIALVAGSLGGHRFYLHGFRDVAGWLHWPPTLLGLYGVHRMRVLGQDDVLAWVLIPLFGLMLAVSMLAAIVYGLTPDARWNARLRQPEAQSIGWLNVLGVVLALLLGGTALMATIAFTAQHWFEWQIRNQNRGRLSQ